VLATAAAQMGGKAEAAQRNGYLHHGWMFGTSGLRATADKPKSIACGVQTQLSAAFLHQKSAYLGLFTEILINWGAQLRYFTSLPLHCCINFVCANASGSLTPAI